MPREDVLREGVKDGHQIKKCVVKGRVCTTGHQEASNNVRFQVRCDASKYFLITA
jgi:hypothetical protein